MKVVNVTLAGREYAVTPLPIKKNREWRKQFEAPIKDAANLLAEVGSYATVEYKDAGDMIGNLGKAISGSLSPVINHLLGSADLITEAVFLYSPEIKKDKKYIEENGFDTEIVTAFLAILSLAFPFGQAIQGLLKLGQQEPQTAQSSASPSSE